MILKTSCSQTKTKVQFFALHIRKQHVAIKGHASFGFGRAASEGWGCVQQLVTREI